MTTNQPTQNGVAHLVLLLAIVIVAAAAFVGYRVWSSQNEEGSPAETINSQALVPETINDASDLEQATEAVNQTPLDNDLNPDQFDQDVGSLL